MATNNNTLVPQELLDRLSELDKLLKVNTSSMKNLLTESDAVFTSFNKGAKTYKEFVDNVNRANEVEKEAAKVVSEAKSAMSEKEKIQQKIIQATSKEAQEVAKLNLQLQNIRKTNRDLAKESQAAANSIEAQRIKVAKLKKEWASAEIGSKAFKQLEKDLAKANKELTKMEGKGGIYGRNVGNYKSGLSGVFNLAKGFLSIGAAVNVLKGATETIIDFEQANANLATVLGKSAKEITGLTNSAKQLGSTTEWMASEVTQLQTELAKLGFNEDEIMNMQASVLQFATAMDADLGRAATVAGAALRAFNLDSTETERVTASMAVAADRSALSFSDFETAMSIVSPVANSFGFTIEDTVSLLGTLSNAGFDASSAATATRNILLNLADANGKLAKRLGGPVKTIPELSAALVRLRESGVELSETLELTDKRSVSAFNTFMEGAESLVDLRKELEDTGGELERIQKERLDTVQGSIKLLNSAWEGLMLSFYNSKGAMKVVVDGLTTIINKTTQLLQDANQLATNQIDQIKTEASKNRVNYMNEETLEIERLSEKYIDLGQSEKEALKSAARERLPYWEKNKNNLTVDIQELKEELSKLYALTENKNPLYFAFTKYGSLKGAREEAVRLGTEIGRLEARLISTNARIEAGNKIINPEKEEIEPNPSQLTKEQQEAINKIIQDSSERALKEQANTNKRILMDEKNSYEERIAALEAYLANKKDLLKLSAQKEKNAMIKSLTDQGLDETTAKEKIKNELALIDENLENNLNSIKKDGAETRTQIAQDEIENLIKEREKTADTKLEEEYNEKLLELSQQYANGEIKTQEEYNKRKKELQKQYQEESFNSNLEFLQELLKDFVNEKEVLTAVQEQIDKLRLENTKKTNQEIIENNEETAEKEKEKEDAKKEFLQSSLDFANNIADGIFEGQLNNLEKEDEANEEHYNKQIEDVDNKLKQGVITEEEAAAQKEAIEQQRLQKEKEIEQQRAEIQRKQAIFEKASAITSIAIQTALAITKQLAATPLPAGAPLVRIIASLGAAQLLKVLAQPLPTYEQGTGDHIGGSAIVGDGNRPEMIVTPSGQVFKTPSTPTVVDLPQHSIVLPDWDRAIMAMALMNSGNMEDNRPLVIAENGQQLNLLKENNQLTKKLIKINVARNAASGRDYKKIMLNKKC